MFYAAIDPLAMVFSQAAYSHMVELWHPHVPKVADIVTVLKDMSPEEQRATVNRAKTLRRLRQGRRAGGRGAAKVARVRDDGAFVYGTRGLALGTIKRCTHPQARNSLLAETNTPGQALESTRGAICRVVTSI